VAKRLQRPVAIQANSSSGCADYLAKAVSVLNEGLRKTGKPSRKMAGHGDLVRSLLLTMEGLYRGRIAGEDLRQALASIPKRFRPASLPDVLSPEEAWKLGVFFEGIERRRKGAAREVLSYLGSRFSAPRGAPPLPEIYALGQRAAGLMEKDSSWAEISRRICPDRGTGHTCGKACQDRIRSAAKSFVAN